MIEHLKKALDIKADTDKVNAKLREERQDVESLCAAFGEQVQAAFAHVATVESQFQAHVTHGFA